MIGKSITQRVAILEIRTEQKEYNIGLFPGQEMMLMRLWQKDNQSLNALGKSLGINHSTIAKSVRRLEEGVLLL